MESLKFPNCKTTLVPIEGCKIYIFFYKSFLCLPFGVEAISFVMLAVLVKGVVGIEHTFDK